MSRLRARRAAGDVDVDRQHVRDAVAGGVRPGEHAAGDGARADGHDQARLGHRLVRAQRGLLEVAGHDAR